MYHGVCGAEYTVSFRFLSLFLLSFFNIPLLYIIAPTCTADFRRHPIVTHTKSELRNRRGPKRHPGRVNLYLLTYLSSGFFSSFLCVVMPLINIHIYSCVFPSLLLTLRGFPNAWHPTADGGTGRS